MCYEAELLRNYLGCGCSAGRHCFCSQCVVKLHLCSLCRQRHPLCASPPPRETQDEDLSMETIRMLATMNVSAPHDHIGGGDSPDVEWLETLKSPTPPLARAPDALRAGGCQQGTTLRTGPRTTSPTTWCGGVGYPSAANDLTPGTRIP